MRQPIAPWQVWWVDLEPIRGHEQGRRRPAVVVSSGFHLRMTARKLITIVPMTTRERAGWPHHIRVQVPGGPTSWAMTEQIRTLSDTRLLDDDPVHTLTAAEQMAVRAALGQMLII